MFDKKFKIKIVKGCTKYNLYYDQYRIFPQWKPLPIFHKSISSMNDFCADRDKCVELVEYLDSCGRVLEWMDTQESLKLKSEEKLNCKKKSLPDYIIF